MKVHVISRRNVQRFINKHGSISFDRQKIDKLFVEGKVTHVQTVDTLTRHTFTADIKTLRDNALIYDTPHGERYFLAVEYFDWKIPRNPTPMKMPPLPNLRELAIFTR